MINDPPIPIVPTDYVINSRIFAGYFIDGALQKQSKLSVGEQLFLKPEPENEKDCWAVAIYDKDGNKLGYVDAHLAHRMNNVLDYDVFVLSQKDSSKKGIPIQIIARSEESILHSVNLEETFKPTELGVAFGKEVPVDLNEVYEEKARIETFKADEFDSLSRIWKGKMVVDFSSTEDSWEGKALIDFAKGTEFKPVKKEYSFRDKAAEIFSDVIKPKKEKFDKEIKTDKLSLDIPDSYI